MYVPEAHHPRGVARIEGMPIRGALRVFSKGLQTARLARFIEGKVPRVLDVTLHDLESLEGVVTYSGNPVPGARVELLCAYPATDVSVPTGPYFYYSYDDFSDTSALDGSFRIYSEFPTMQVFLRATKTGYAPCTAGPYIVSAPSAPVTLELGLGGEVQGTIQVPRASATHHIAELYRNEPMDGRAVDATDYHSTAVTEELGFRFENVAPGPWLLRVRSRDEEVLELWSGLREDKHIPSVIQVDAGEPIVVRIDVSKPVAVFEGHLTLDERPWVKAVVYLHALEEPGLLIDCFLVDEEGRFKLRAREEGRYWLVVHGDHQHSGEPRSVSTIVRLSRGGKRHELSLARGPDVPLRLVVE